MKLTTEEQALVDLVRAKAKEKDTKWNRTEANDCLARLCALARKSAGALPRIPPTIISRAGIVGSVGVRHYDPSFVETALWRDCGVVLKIIDENYKVCAIEDPATPPPAISPTPISDLTDRDEEYLKQLKLFVDNPNAPVVASPEHIADVRLLLGIIFNLRLTAKSSPLLKSSPEIAKALPPHGEIVCHYNHHYYALYLDGSILSVGQHNNEGYFNTRIIPLLEKLGYKTSEARFIDTEHLPSKDAKVWPASLAILEDHLNNIQLIKKQKKIAYFEARLSELRKELP